MHHDIMWLVVAITLVQLQVVILRSRVNRRTIAGNLVPLNDDARRETLRRDLNASVINRAR